MSDPNRSASRSGKTRARRARQEEPGNVRKLVRSVRGALDEGASAVEEIHKAIADAPLEVLERLDVLPATMADVRRAQDGAIEAIYRAVRKVNHEVTELTADLLERAPRRPASAVARSRARRPRPTRGAATEAKTRAG